MRPQLIGRRASTQGFQFSQKHQPTQQKSRVVVEGQ